MTLSTSSLYVLFLLGLNWIKITTYVTIEACVLKLFTYASKLNQQNLFVHEAPKQCHTSQRPAER